MTASDIDSAIVRLKLAVITGSQPPGALSGHWRFISYSSFRACVDLLPRRKEASGARSPGRS
jgi:hypothetical protein